MPNGSSNIGTENRDLVIDGDLVIKNRATKRIVLRIDSVDGSITVFNKRGLPVFKWEMPGANIRLGGGASPDDGGHDGDIVVFGRSARDLDDLSRSSLHYNADNEALLLGGDRTSGGIALLDKDRKQTVVLHAGDEEGVSRVRVGGEQTDGLIEVLTRDEAVRERATIQGGRYSARDDNGRTDHTVGGVFASIGSRRTVELFREGELLLNNDRNAVRIGGANGEGFLQVGGGTASTSDAILLDGERATVSIGYGLGPMEQGRAGTLLLRDAKGWVTVEGRGKEGDLLFQGADCAEEFEIAPGVDVRPGTVMSVAQSGKLEASVSAYDTRVVGIVSGAGDLRPGIVLGRRRGNGAAVPIALAGRAMCWVDTRESAVQAGDMLTTSSVPGHAMKAEDRGRAFGSTIGKALDSAAKGAISQVPVLVALQ